MIAKADIIVEHSRLLSTPSKLGYSLDQLLKEQVQLEREMGRRVTDQEFLDDKPIGKEILLSKETGNERTV